MTNPPITPTTNVQTVSQEHLSNLLWNFILKTGLDKVPMAVKAFKEYTHNSSTDELEDILADFDNEAEIDYMQYKENGTIKFVKDLYSIKNG